MKRTPEIFPRHKLAGRGQDPSITIDDTTRNNSANSLDLQHSKEMVKHEQCYEIWICGVRTDGVSYGYEPFEENFVARKFQYL